MGSVSRSKSFTSSTSSFGSGGGYGSMLFRRPKFPFTGPNPVSSSLGRGTKYGYLGQHMGPPGGSSDTSPGGGGSQGMGGVKINPNKTCSTIRGLQGGLRDAITILEEDLAKHHSNLQGHQSQGRRYEMERTAKGLTLQLKTLEYQLSRLDSLEEAYTLQRRLREGVQNMGVAYTLSTGHHSKLALANVKAGWRECTLALGTLEGQLQEFLGAFHLTMKGIQGFARLCPGDVYEIVVKHGAQKWRCRTKVGKDGGQEWDFGGAKIFPILGQDLFIKAAEVKTLGKQVLLGNKFCEICHLFSAHPQLMTVNLNPSGSLKLNLMVEWEPLAQFSHGGGGVGGGSIRGHGVEGEHSPQRKRRMLISPMGSCTGRGRGRDNQSNIHLEGGSSPGVGDIGGVRGEVKGQGEELRDNLVKLSSILNDEIQGQYPELEVLEVNVAALRGLAFQEWPDFRCGSGCVGGSGRMSRSSSSQSTHHPFGTSTSSSSLNIASALEAFDFLDSEVSSPQGEENGRGCGIQHQGNPTSASHDFSASSLRLHPVEEEGVSKVGVGTPLKAKGVGGTLNSDSGISSLASTSSRSPSPGDRGHGKGRSTQNGVLHPSTSSPWVTGSEELDLVLHTHVLLCLKLVQSLGSFGPLKCRENSSLSKLHGQGVILGNVLSRIRSQGTSSSGGGVPKEFEGSRWLSSMWTEVTGSASPLTLVTTADQVSFGLEGEIRSFLSEEDAIQAPHLAKTIVLQMLGGGGSGSGGVEEDKGAAFRLQRHLPLTLFQFTSYLKPYQASFPRLVRDIAEEELLVSGLSDPGSGDEVRELLTGLGSSIPATPTFLPLIRLLSHDEASIRGVVTSFLLQMAYTRRKELVSNCLELLEEEESSARGAALSVLDLIMGEGEEEDSVEEGMVLEGVAYLAQTDPDPGVREGARRILSRNTAGGRLHAQLTLNSNGFQGLLAN